MKRNFLLTIMLNDDKNTASLVGVKGITNENNVLAQFGKYEGFNNYKTDNVLRIDVGEYEGKQYVITNIKPCSVSHCREVKEIFIGAKVKQIEWNMYQCISLVNIRVDAKNVVYHDIEGVLFKDNELIAFPHGRRGKYVVPNGTKRIGNHSFKSSQIQEIILPDSLEEIGVNAFYECKFLSEITLPRGIQKVSRNYDKNHIPIKQHFYLAEDTDRSNPLTITEIIKMFPE